MEELVYSYPYGLLNQFDTKRVYENFIVTEDDKKILRELAKQKANIAKLSIHQEKIHLWKSLNSMKETRPLVCINEIPWHELNVEDELTIQSKTGFAKFLETRLRRAIYCWKHLPVDMVIETTLPCYLIIDNTGFGISEDAQIATTDKDSDIVSREFIPQIHDEEDIDKIKTPIIYYDEKSTNLKYETMKDIFDGILKIEKKGIPGFWFAPWDELIRWWGVQQALTDLVLRPKLVHKIMDRLTKSYISMLNQYESQNLLALNNCNYRIGSGGLSFTNELPGRDYTPTQIKTHNLWGSGAAQIFSDVSPDMHYEFALQYELRWMERFGLNYYGCCEPLNKKIDILNNIPNLRKISISPWADLDDAIEKMKGRFVISYKPNPAIFTVDNWDIKNIKSQVLKILPKFKGCNVEIIMKDISTVKYKPQRLWEWAKTIMDILYDLHK